MKTKNKSSLFLMELIVAIFFFAASAAETVKASPEGWQRLEYLTPTGEGQAVVEYDKDWRPISGSPSGAVYRMELLDQGDGSTRITVKKGEETLFSIEAVPLHREGGGGFGQ